MAWSPILSSRSSLFSVGMRHGHLVVIGIAWERVEGKLLEGGGTLG